MRSAGRRSLDCGLLLLRVGSSELVAACALRCMRLLVLLGWRLMGSAMLVWCGAGLLSFLGHGSCCGSRYAELVAIAVEDHESI